MKRQPKASRAGNGFRILAAELTADLKNIEAIAACLDDVHGQARQRPLTDLEVSGAAHWLEGFYTAVEDLFTRIARTVDQDMPAGEQWHRELLERMALDIPGVRPAVIGSTLAATLDEYRRFRHRARHVYSPPVPKWEKFSHLVAGLPEVMGQLRQSVRDFIRVLEQLGTAVEEE